MPKKLIILLGAWFLTAALLPRVAEAQTEMRSVPGRRNALGFSYSGLPDFSQSPPRWADYPVVRHVYETSPAQAAGLEVGDVVLKVNGRDGCETEAYLRYPIGSRVTLLVQRGREQKEISFVLTEPNWPDKDWVPTLGSQ